MTTATQTITRLAALPAFRPMTRSRTARERAVRGAKSNIAHYMAMVKAEANAVRGEDLASAQRYRKGAVLGLLWSMAFLEQALYLETGGRMGEWGATPTTVLRRLPVKGASHTDDND